jgi:hypothetical protein
MKIKTPVPEGKTVDNLSKYIITDAGEIYSKYNKNYMTLIITDSGYMRITLRSDDYKKKCYFVHRLVMSAFYGPSLLHVNHKNCDSSDNRLENLEYVTASENIKHSFKHGTNKHRVRAVYKIDPRTNEKVKYDSIREAYRYTKINHRTIQAVCSGVGKTAGGFKWEYVQNDYYDIIQIINDVRAHSNENLRQKLLSRIKVLKKLDNIDDDDDKEVTDIIDTFNRERGDYDDIICILDDVIKHPTNESCERSLLSRIEILKNLENIDDTDDDEVIDIINQHKVTS